jgi:uncharacterized membrane protein SirB2
MHSIRQQEVLFLFLILIIFSFAFNSISFFINKEKFRQRFIISTKIIALIFLTLIFYSGILFLINYHKS